MRYYINKISIYIMPPKQSQAAKSFSVGKPKSEAKSERQTKIFSKEFVEPQVKPEKVTKTKSRQFGEADLKDLPQTVTNHTAMWRYGTGVTPNSLLIANWNVNGIRAVMGRDEINKYINTAKPDILCLNQTKIDHATFTKTPIQAPTGYHGYWNFCKCSAGYSGVAIFSKFLPISVRQDLPEKEHSQEGRVLTIQFQKFFLITAYIPNSGHKLDRLKYRVQEYDIAFQNYCQSLKKQKPVIVCGDLNVAHQQIDVRNPKTNLKTAGFTVEERDSFTAFLKKGWVDTFRRLHPTEVKYSWWSTRANCRAKNIGWRLDYFLVNEDALKIVKESQINNDVFGSDHCPVELTIAI